MNEVWIVGLGVDYHQMYWHGPFEDAISACRWLTDHQGDYEVFTVQPVLEP